MGCMKKAYLAVVEHVKLDLAQPFLDIVLLPICLEWKEEINEAFAAHPATWHARVHVYKN